MVRYRYGMYCTCISGEKSMRTCNRKTRKNWIMFKHWILKQIIWLEFRVNNQTDIAVDLRKFLLQTKTIVYNNQTH